MNVEAGNLSNTVRVWRDGVMLSARIEGLLAKSLHLG